MASAALEETEVTYQHKLDEINTSLHAPIHHIHFSHSVLQAKADAEERYLAVILKCPSLSHHCIRSLHAAYEFYRTLENSHASRLAYFVCPLQHGLVDDGYGCLVPRGRTLGETLTELNVSVNVGHVKKAMWKLTSSLKILHGEHYLHGSICAECILLESGIFQNPRLLPPLIGVLSTYLVEDLKAILTALPEYEMSFERLSEQDVHAPGQSGKRMLTLDDDYESERIRDNVYDSRHELLHWMDSCVNDSPSIETLLEQSAWGEYTEASCRKHIDFESIKNGVVNYNSSNRLHKKFIWAEALLRSKVQVEPGEH